jgi:hypothetical protein
MKGHLTPTQSLNTHVGIGEDRDVSNAANQKPTPKCQLGISLLVLSGVRLMSLGQLTDSEKHVQLYKNFNFHILEHFSKRNRCYMLLLIECNKMKVKT